MKFTLKTHLVHVLHILLSDHRRAAEDLFTSASTLSSDKLGDGNNPLNLTGQLKHCSFGTLNLMGAGILLLKSLLSRAKTNPGPCSLDRKCRLCE